MSSHWLDDTAHWRARAEQARRLAMEMADEISKAMMLGVADDYDNVANRAELRHRDRFGPARSKAANYREKARHCEEQATACGISDAKQSLLDLAAEWRAMAHQLERGDNSSNV
jgi:hypothetical protein